jgi:hypothetical protein
MKITSKSGRWCELIIDGDRIKRTVGRGKDSGTVTYISVDQIEKVLRTELNLSHHEKTLDLTDDVRPIIQGELFIEYRNFTSSGVQPSLISVEN